MKTLYYVAHPFGNDDSNRVKVEEIIKELMELRPTWNFFSPIHASGFQYALIPYIEGMNWCLNMLSRCDALILCEGWENSKGCCMEYACAIAKEIPIYEFKTKTKTIYSR